MTRQRSRPVFGVKPFLAAALPLLWAGSAYALPNLSGIAGYTGVGPGATFNTTVPGTLAVNQSSDRVVINWNSFNIAGGETVKFSQPTRSSIAFNIVTGGASTSVLGNLSANGGVWLFSPAGLLFGPHATVSTGSFLASTGIFNSTSMAQALGLSNSVQIFPQATPGAGSINLQSGGSIAASAGFVLLHAPTITQDGAVSASDVVAYNANADVQVQIAPSANLSSIALTNEVSSTSAPAARISHTGTTTAGTWFEADAGGASSNAPGGGVINLGGVVSASSMKSAPGAGSGYSVILGGGTINVTGGASSPGAITLNASGAVNVTGLIGAGGSVLIGASQLTLGANGGVAAGASGVSTAQAGVMTTYSATSNIELQNSTSANYAPNRAAPAAGDILLGAPVNLPDPVRFQITAHHALTVTAQITDSGLGELDLNTDQGAREDYSFSATGALTFTAPANTGQTLYINGNPEQLIFSQADLLLINNNLYATYALGAPLDLATANVATVFTGAPIASTSGQQFNGTFTGLGNTISDLTIQATTPIGQFTQSGRATTGAIGLFGFVGSSGVVRDVKLSNASVAGLDGMQAGALVGNLDGTVKNASSSGKITTGGYTTTAIGQDSSDTFWAAAGGLVGLSDGQIVNSHSSATVAAGSGIAGGLAGLVVNSGLITNSSASGSVTVGDSSFNPSYAGGLVGYVFGFNSNFSGANAPSISIAGSSAAGSVSGGVGSFVGGFAGQATEATIGASYSAGAVSGGMSSYAGGFAGQLNGGQVSGSFATGSVSQIAQGQNLAGGFAGEVTGGETIAQSYSSGAVSTVGGPGGLTTLAGGFAGEVDGVGSVVSTSYALGAVAATGANADVGGFAGVVQQSAGVDHVYATGHVTGTGTVAGLVAVLGNPAAADMTGSLSNAYWDEGTTSQTVGYHITPPAMPGGGQGAATNVVGIGGMTGLSPYAATSYANFDLVNTWYIIAGETRPILRSEYSTTIANAHQLQLIGLNPAANYILGADFDAGETASVSDVWNPANGFVPVGTTAAAPFTGTFDGQGHTVSNLKIIDLASMGQTVAGTPTGGAVGLFGFVGAGATINNVNLANANVTGGDGMSVGLLVGTLSGTVSHATSSGIVTTGNGAAIAVGFANATAGGLVGSVTSSGLVASSSSAAAVNGGQASTGGLVGELDGGAIQNSFATGTSKVGANAGGQTPTAGGLVGSALITNGVTPSISGSYATGSVVAGGGSNAGGLIGRLAQGKIANSHAAGSVTQLAGGQNAVSDIGGGFVGFAGVGSTVTNSYSSGAVSTVGGPGGLTTLAGGFAGEVDGVGSVVSTSYALGAVAATGANADVGGFAGVVQQSAGVDHVYATGHVTGTGTVAGLVAVLGNPAAADMTGSLSNAYWDEGTTSQTVGYHITPPAMPGGGQGAATNVVGIGGMTGLSPYAATSYANFDLVNTWYIIAGETRPILRSEYSTTIANAHQLQLIGLNPAANYILGADFDAGETASVSDVWNPANGFVPVGTTAAAPFTGTFDGQGHTVSNLKIIDLASMGQTVAGTPTGGAVGLFGFVGAGATINNVNLANANVTGGDGMSVGLLVGTLSGTVSHATSSGIVTTGNGAAIAVGFANATAGGLVGSVTSSGLVASSSSAAAVNGGQASTGGLVGELDGGAIQNSFATGTVDPVGPGSQTPTAGGLVGSALVTNGVTPTISGSYATGAVLAGGDSVAGGLIGLSQGIITTSYASGTVTFAASTTGAGDKAGGFAGEISGGHVSQSFSTGAVKVTGSATPAEVGGFVGEVVNGGVISDAYATGAVAVSGSGPDDVGGFAGMISNASSASNFYATGAVSGAGQVAGLVGKLGGSITNGYWDLQTTGQNNGYNTLGGASANNVAGLTPANRFVPATYQGFDFSAIWSIPTPGSYPQLYGVSHVINFTAQPASVTYGNFPVFTVVATGLQGGDTYASAVQALQVQPQGASTSQTSGYYNASDPANPYSLSIAGAAVSGPSGPYRVVYNDNATTFDGALTVTPAQLTIAATPDTKTYDGTQADTNLSPNAFGLVAGDGVNATQSYDGPHAGNHTLTVDPGYSVNDGNQANPGANYVVTLDPTPVAGTITPAPININATSDTKTYDGTTNSSQTPTYGNQFFNNDGVTNLTQAYVSKDVLGSGQNVLAVTGYTFSDPGDYVAVTSNAPGTINAAVLTLSATADSRQYNGTTSSNQTPTYNPSQLFGDTVTGLSQVFNGKDVRGSNLSTLLVAGYTVNDGNGGNDYVVTLNTAQGTITPAPLVLSAVTDSKRYDGTTTSSGTPTYNASQLFGDTVTGLSQAFNSKAVLGANHSTLSVAGYTVNDGNGGNDYAVTLNTAQGTVTPAPLVLNAVTDSKRYDGTTSSAGAPTYDPTQLMGDTVTGLSQSFNSKDVLGQNGSLLKVTGYTVNDGNMGRNYTVGFNPATGTITAAPLVVSATSGAKTYDGGTSSGQTPSGATLFSNDTITGTEKFNSKNVLGAGLSTLSVTSYTVNDGNGGLDYSVTQINTASGTITPKGLTAALTGIVEKTYDGTTAATLASNNYALPGVIGGDQVVLSTPTSGAYDTRNAGTAKVVSVAGLTISGQDAGNYTVGGAATGAVGTIDPAALTLSASSSVKVYDGSVSSSAIPTHGVLIGGDGISNLVENYDSRTAGSRTLVVTGYTIADGNNGGNYSVATTTAAGTITPKVLTVALIGTVIKTYDGTTNATLASNNYSLPGVIGADQLVLNNPTAGMFADSSPGLNKIVSVAGLAISGGDAANYLVNGSAAAPIGQINGLLAYVAPPTVSVTSFYFDEAAAAFASTRSSAVSINATIVNVFPVGADDANSSDSTKFGDNAPITGAGNRDLWSGADLTDKTCSLTTPAGSCPAAAGNKP